MTRTEAPRAHLYVVSRRGIFGFHRGDGEPQVLPYALYGHHVRAALVDASGRLIAAATRDHGLHWSKDGGATFAAASGFDGGEAQVLAGTGSSVWIGASPAALYRSDDGGATCSRLPGFDAAASPAWTASGGAAHAQVSALLTAGERVIVAVLAGGILVSEDGGKVFHDATGSLPPAVHALAWAPGGEAVLAGTGAGLFRVDPGKGSRERLLIDPDRPAVTAIAVHPRSPEHWVAAVARDVVMARPAQPQGADSALLWSQDGGKTWTSAGGPRLPVIRGSIVSLIHGVSDPEHVFAGTTSSEVFESRDGGRTFEMIAATLPGLLHLVAGPALHRELKTR